MTETPPRKWVIIDPCCYPSGGHNIESCLRFAEQIEESGGAIEEFWLAGDSTKVERKGYKVRKLPKTYVQLTEEKFETKLKFKFYRTVTISLKLFAGRLIDHLLRKIAKSALSRNLSQLDAAHQYILYFPSTDYYFALEAIRILKNND